MNSKAHLSCQNNVLPRDQPVAQCCNRHMELGHRLLGLIQHAHGQSRLYDVLKHAPRPLLKSCVSLNDSSRTSDSFTPR